MALWTSTVCLYGLVRGVSRTGTYPCAGKNIGHLSSNRAGLTGKGSQKKHDTGIPFPDRMYNKPEGTPTACNVGIDVQAEWKTW
jgi:hypothetical protein